MTRFIAVKGSEECSTTIIAKQLELVISIFCTVRESWAADQEKRNNDHEIMSSIKLFSLNLWNLNEDFKKRMQIVDQWVNNMAPDIVFLQEVSKDPDSARLQADLIYTGAASIKRFYASQYQWDERGSTNPYVQADASDDKWIDYIFTSTDMNTLSCSLALDGVEDAPIASDHFALKAEIELPKNIRD